MELSIGQAAGLLHVKESTVRSRLRSGELRRAPGAGPVRVWLEPGDFIRSEDAAAILGVSPTTVRSAIDRGELAGKRVQGGRWRVRLDSVLSDPRAAESAAQLGSGAPETVEEETSFAAPRRPGRHDVFVRLDEHEIALLELAAARHGSKRQAVATALSVLIEQDATPGEVAELRAEHAAMGEQLAQRDKDLRELASVARRQLVDELYCPRCEQMVPVEGWGYARDEETGMIEVYHRAHGHARHGRMRTGSVMAHRHGRPRDDDEARS